MSKINDEGFLELSGVNRNALHEDLNVEKFPILQGLTPLSLRVINQSCRVMNIAQGVEMMHAGDTPHDLYFITKGSFHIVKMHDGKMQPIATLGPGHLYGEYGALRGKTRYASVVAAEPSSLIRVDLHSIQQVLDADSHFKARVYDLMRSRMLNSFLFGHKAFSHLSEDAREQVSNFLQLKEFVRDDVIFAAGEKANAYYLILSGEVEICCGSSKNQIVMEIRRDNDVLGETRLENGSKWAYTAQAANSVDLIILDQMAMNAIHKTDASVMPKLNQMMGAQMKETIPKIKAAFGN